MARKIKYCDVCLREGKQVKSVPGLISSVGLCQYHFNVRFYGKEWADKCREKVQS